jgi:hypothetical protein
MKGGGIKTKYESNEPSGIEGSLCSSAGSWLEPSPLVFSPSELVAIFQQATVFRRGAMSLVPYRQKFQERLQINRLLSIMSN